MKMNKYKKSNKDFYWELFLSSTIIPFIIFIIFIICFILYNIILKITPHIEFLFSYFLSVLIIFSIFWSVTISNYFWFFHNKSKLCEKCYCEYSIYRGENTKPLCQNCINELKIK